VSMGRETSQVLQGQGALVVVLAGGGGALADLCAWWYRSCMRGIQRHDNILSRVKSEMRHG
jgi:hypothetical protein